jgi:hypothetical protein
VAEAVERCRIKGDSPERSGHVHLTPLPSWDVPDYQLSEPIWSRSESEPGVMAYSGRSAGQHYASFRTSPRQCGKGGARECASILHNSPDSFYVSYYFDVKCLFTQFIKRCIMQGRSKKRTAYQTIHQNTHFHAARSKLGLSCYYHHPHRPCGYLWDNRTGTLVFPVRQRD